MKVISEIEVEKIKRIGANQGRNSEVWLAKDTQLNGEVVLKEIPINTIADPNDYFREAQIIYANKHPRIVPINYACKDGNYIRMTMPYYPNGSLQDILDKKPLSIGRLIKIAQEFLNGLHYVHISKFVHYDVKPTNIFIADDGSAMLADFGQTRPVNNFGLASIPPNYTKHTAPELIGNIVSTKLTDIYHCGLTLYRMCNGSAYFEQQFDKYKLPNDMIDGRTLAKDILDGKFPDRKLYLPHVPKKIRKIINTAIQIDPKKRYQSALELMNELGKVDTLLDWQYEETGNGGKWEKFTIEHMYEVVLVLDQQDRLWRIHGRTVKIVDGSVRNRSAWTRNTGYKKRNEAEKELYKIFDGMD
jgi:serine/threonine protein kinase